MGHAAVVAFDLADQTVPSGIPARRQARRRYAGELSGRALVVIAAQ
jgi:hypothetical protein